MRMKLSTRCVHFGDLSDPYGATTPPIYQTATFRQPTASEVGEFDYTRSGNPTRSLLERHLAALEGGAYACAFASGMAAITALTRRLNSGDEIIAGDDLCGHSDVTAGTLITNDPSLHEQIAFQQNAEGAGLSPFESWLLLRGLKTLAIRVKQQNESANKVAEFLETQPRIKKVYYPGLKH